LRSEDEVLNHCADSERKKNVGLERFRRQELNSFGGCVHPGAFQVESGFEDFTTYMDRELR
jgi:hypothetical protein